MSQPQEEGIGAQAWHTDDDIPARRVMIADIVARLTQRQPNAPAGWYERLPSMCSRLEQSLYMDAPSFEAYDDRGTLGVRLQGLGRRIQQLQEEREAEQESANTQDGD